MMKNTSDGVKNLTCLQNDDGGRPLVVNPALFDSHFNLAMIYISVIAVALFIGTFGNLMILLVAFWSRGLNKVGKEFMVNLALADLCVAAIADPMCIVGVIKGEHFFSDKPWLCNLIASMCLTACFCAFASLTMLSLNRYVYLCHNEIYDKMYGRITCIVICVMCWITAFLCEFPNFVGWGGHYFDQQANQCIWDRTSSLSYTLFVAIGLIGFPLLTMTICFILIFRRIWNTKKALYDIDKGKDGRMGKVMVESFRAAKTIFVIFVVFVICWTPYAVVIAIDVENTLPMPVHLFLTLLAHLHSSCNFIIYFVGNKRFRVVLGRILGCHDKTAILSETKSSSVPDSPDTTRYNNFSGIKPQLKITKKQTSTGSDSYDGHM
ncbi:unnamed protein product [Mytilus edulis]|uniref:G-protein coupled receptors family 1 profile domain-containing protein n=1 Tax=Mytilus edulis TaxID=6550 RepID=A0A8S3TJ48_MYTED|nr:unnamed protein product [Mytilus edulis]